MTNDNPRIPRLNHRSFREVALVLKFSGYWVVDMFSPVIPEADQAPLKHEVPASRRTAPWLRCTVCILLFAGAVGCLLMLGGGETPPEVHAFEPAPDSAEQVWVGGAMAKGTNLLIPLGNELYPSRYSPVHPFMMSLHLRFNSVFTYSVTATVLAAAIIMAALVASEVPLFAAALMILFLLCSPGVIKASMNVMQESSMLLFFALALLSSTWCFRPRSHSAFASLAGFSTGALACMRPTAAPLFLLMLAVLLLRRTDRKRLLAFGLGAGVVLIACCSYTLLVAGIFSPAAYRYWGFNAANMFSLSRPFVAPLADEWVAKAPHGLVIVNDYFGTSNSLFGIPLAGRMLLIAGVVFLAMEPRLPAVPQASAFAPLRLSLLICAAFAGTQMIVHSFYIWYDSRFQLVGAVGWFLASAVGLWRAGHYLLKSAFLPVYWRRCAWSSSFAAASILAAMGFYNTERNVSLQFRKPHLTRMHVAHAANQKRLRAMQGPVFGGGIPLLNARMILGLNSFPFPVAPLTNEKIGHLFDLTWNPKVAPRATLHSPSIWPGRVSETFLVDTSRGVVNLPTLTSIGVAYKEFALYFPVKMTPAVTPLLRTLDGGGYVAINASKDPLVCFLIVRHR